MRQAIRNDCGEIIGSFDPELEEQAREEWEWERANEDDHTGAEEEWEEAQEELERQKKLALLAGVESNLRAFGFRTHAQTVQSAVEELKELRDERDTCYMDYRIAYDKKTKGLVDENEALRVEIAQLKETIVRLALRLK